MTVHPLDLIRINVRRIHLYSRRQIDNDWVFFRCAPGFLNCGTDFKGKIHLCSGKAFRGIFQDDLAREVCGIFFYQLGSLYRNVHDMRTVHVEHDISLQCGRRVINMYNCLLAALNRFKSTCDQFFPALCQHLNIYVIRNHIMLNQVAQEIEFNLARCRETNFDFLKAQLYQILEHFNLFFYYHRIYQRLIAVAQVYAAPYGCFLNLFAWPLALRIVNYRITAVFLIIHHCFFSPFVSCHSDCIYEQCSCHFDIRYRVWRPLNALLTLVSNNRMHALRAFYCHEKEEPSLKICSRSDFLF